MTEESWAKGYGFEELAERWNLPGWKDVDYDDLPSIISKYLYECDVLEGGSNQDDVDAEERMHRVAADLRVFLIALADREDRIGYHAPLWRGLAAIEHDGELLKMASKLVEHMWS